MSAAVAMSSFERPYGKNFEEYWVFHEACE